MKIRTALNAKLRGQLSHNTLEPYCGLPNDELGATMVWAFLSSNHFCTFLSSPWKFHYLINEHTLISQQRVMRE